MSAGWCAGVCGSQAARSVRGCAEQLADVQSAQPGAQPHHVSFPPLSCEGFIASHRNSPAVLGPFASRPSAMAISAHKAWAPAQKEREKPFSAFGIIMAQQP